MDRHWESLLHRFAGRADLHRRSRWLGRTRAKRRERSCSRFPQTKHAARTTEKLRIPRLVGRHRTEASSPHFRNGSRLADGQRKIAAHRCVDRRINCDWHATVEPWPPTTSNGFAEWLHGRNADARSAVAIDKARAPVDTSVAPAATINVAFRIVERFVSAKLFGDDISTKNACVRLGKAAQRHDGDGATKYEPQICHDQHVADDDVAVAKTQC